MAIFKQDTFIGINGERVVVTMHNSFTEMNVYTSDNAILEMGHNIVGEWPFVKDGRLHYTTTRSTPTGVVYDHETLSYEMRPVISWSKK